MPVGCGRWAALLRIRTKNSGTTRRVCVCRALLRGLLRYDDLGPLNGKRGGYVAEVTPTGRRVGERLRRLIDGLGPDESGRPLTVDAFYKLIENEPDVEISRSQLYKLVDGKFSPRLQLIEGLARYFGVSPAYFVVGETPNVDATTAKVDAAIEEVDAMMQRLSELRAELVRERRGVGSQQRSSVRRSAGSRAAAGSP